MNSFLFMIKFAARLKKRLISIHWTHIFSLIFIWCFEYEWLFLMNYVSLQQFRWDQKYFRSIKGKDTNEKPIGISQRLYDFWSHWPNHNKYWLSYRVGSRICVYIWMIYTEENLVFSSIWVWVWNLITYSSWHGISFCAISLSRCLSCLWPRAEGNFRSHS